MPKRNINLTPQLDNFVVSRIENGPCKNAGEVVRAGLGSLERKEKEYDARFAALLVAIGEAAERGIYESDAFESELKSRQLRSSKTSANPKIDSQ
jgi:antitoxin ParD1/3/4